MNEFNPDYHTLPGEHLREIIWNENNHQNNMPTILGLELIKGIEDGKIIITKEIAEIISTVTKIPISFWLNLEKNYRNWLEKKEK